MTDEPEIWKVIIKGRGAHWDVAFRSSIKENEARITIREFRLIQRALSTAFRVYNRKRAVASHRKVSVENAGTGKQGNAGQVGQGIKDSGAVGGNLKEVRRIVEPTAIAGGPGSASGVGSEKAGNGNQG